LSSLPSSDITTNTGWHDGTYAARASGRWRVPVKGRGPLECINRPMQLAE